MSEVKDLEGEIWKDIEGWEGIYQVSNLGRIKKILGKKEKILSLYTTGGYYGVSFRKPNVHKHYRVHRLIAQAFIPNPENKPFINHIDGNKKNNALSNLEWCTHQENITHAFRILEHGNMKLSMEDVESIRNLEINSMNVKAISKQYNVDYQVVAHLLKNESYKTENSTLINFNNIIEDLDVNKYIGKKFGKLTIINEIKRNDCSKRIKCRCECGDESEYTLNSVLTGKVSMCDSCYNIERLHKRITNHTIFYKGIYLLKHRPKPWKVEASIHGGQQYLGCYKTQKEALSVLNSYFIVNGLEYKTQNYEGEFMIMNDEQRKVQEEWEKQNKK